MRFIHIGVGGFGGVWCKVLQECKAAKVVALVDVNPKALEAVCATGGYPRSICFPTLEEALAQVRADALVCSTPPQFHHHDVATALKAGLHVISEKPMSDSFPSCKDMLKTAWQTRRTYVVSQNYRYAPGMWTLAQVVRSGQLGAIGQVKLDFYLGVDFGGGFRHAMEYPLIIDMSIHHFDLIRFVTGLDAVTVRGSAWNPPWSNYKGDCSSTALFTMNNGARILYNASWCAKGQFNDWNGNWQIECEKGTVTYQQGEIKVHEAPSLYKVTRVRTVRLRQPPRGGQHFVLNDFIRSVTAGKRPQTDAADNIRSVGMVFATVHAMKTGQDAAILDREVTQMLRRKHP